MNKESERVQDLLDNEILAERRYFLKMIDECQGNIEFLKSKVKIQIALREKEINKRKTGANW